MQSRENGRVRAQNGSCNLACLAKHQMYINNYDSWQGFGQLQSLINPKQLFLCGLFWVEIPRGFTFFYFIDSASIRAILLF
mgnify:CR=1 FL=1